MSCAVVSRAALGRFALSDILGSYGTGLLGDDRVVLVVGTAKAGISAVNVRPELGDAVSGGERGDIDEMHRNRL